MEDVERDSLSQWQSKQDEGCRNKVIDCCRIMNEGLGRKRGRWRREGDCRIKHRGRYGARDTVRDLFF